VGVTVSISRHEINTQTFGILSITMTITRAPLKRSVLVHNDYGWPELRSKRNKTLPIQPTRLLASF